MHRGLAGSLLEAEKPRCMLIAHNSQTTENHRIRVTTPIITSLILIGGSGWACASLSVRVRSSSRPVVCWGHGDQPLHFGFVGLPPAASPLASPAAWHAGRLLCVPDDASVQATTTATAGVWCGQWCLG